jgi:glycosyltransferase involved in cell wall biosynthesis
MSSPTVSVVLPVRNGQRYIARAVESILAQSFRDWELIVINDSSSDRTADILRDLSIRHNRIRELTTPSSGLVLALNAGIAASRGELVARMDADDFALPSRFERQVAELSRRPSLVVLGGQIVRIDAQHRKLGRGRYPIGDNSCRRQLSTSAPFCHPAVMLRKKAVVGVGGYRDTFRHAEDYDLWLRLAEVGELDNLADEILHYRVHGYGVTARYSTEQAANAALALLAYRSRQNGRPEPDFGVGATDNFERRLANLTASEDEQLRTWLDYWRLLVLNGGLKDPARSKAFKEVLGRLARGAVRLRATRPFAYMMVRAAHLQVSSGRVWSAAQFLLYSFCVAPVASAREIVVQCIRR